MIDYFISSFIPLTSILIMLLLIRKPVRKKADANTSYGLWAILPFALILYSLELPWHLVSELSNTNIQTYLVQPSESIQQHLITSNITILAFKSIWLTGWFIIVIYWIIAHHSFKKVLKSEDLSESSLSEKLIKSIPTKLAIKQSNHIFSPILMGLFKPTLVIPENFTELYSIEQQELIIAHEVCHYSHHHMWANQVALLLLALFWFHPLAWRSYAAFRQDQEHSCDQTVLARKRLKSRIQYCKALVLAAETSPPNAFTLMSFKHNGEQNFMFNRIEQIKNMSVKSKIFTITKVTLVALVSTTLLAGVSYAGNHLKKGIEAEQARFDVHPIYRIEPKYPLKAAKEKVEGSVLLKFDVKGDGNVTNVEVVNGKPAYVFDKTALTALKQWRYKATGKTTKNLLVQLDYLMDGSSNQPEPLIERIKVTN
jgi:TonB family protein